MNRIVAVVIGMFLLLGISGCISGAKAGGAWGGDPFAALKLSPEQRDTLMKKHQTQRKQLAPLYAELEVAKITLWQLQTEKNPVFAKIKTQISVVSEVKTKIDLQHASSMMSMRSILNDEQWKQWSRIGARHMMAGPRRMPRNNAWKGHGMRGAKGWKHPSQGSMSPHWKGKNKGMQGNPCAAPMPTPPPQ